MFFCQAGSGQICPIEQTARNTEVIDPASGPASGPAGCCDIYYNPGDDGEGKGRGGRRNISVRFKNINIPPSVARAHSGLNIAL